MCVILVCSENFLKVHLLKQENFNKRSQLNSALGQYWNFFVSDHMDWYVFLQQEKTVLQIKIEKDGLLSFVPDMVLHNYICSLLLQICYLDIHFVLAFHIAFDTYMKEK